MKLSFPLPTLPTTKTTCRFQLGAATVVKAIILDFPPLFCSGLGLQLFAQLPISTQEPNKFLKISGHQLIDHGIRGPFDTSL